MFWFWFFVGPAILLALLSLRGERKRAAYVAARLSESPAQLPPASVIVPVKGDDAGLRGNLAALASLDYPDYELIIVARTAEDIPPGVLPSRVRIVLAHGDDPNTGEKVQNLQTAVRAVRKQTQILAFADSDGRVSKGWLKALTAPLVDPNVGASTGYRWFLPQPATFWSLIRSVWDAVAFGRLGPGSNDFAWGGAMAIRRETFFQIRVYERWKNTVSDDYALSAAVRDAGLTIAFAPGALTPSYEPVTCPNFFAWIRRQMVITKVYNPRLWKPALIAHIVYCAAMAASVVAILLGNGLGGWTLAAQLLPGMWKGYRRVRLAKAALPQCVAWFRRNAWAHVLLTPFATWVWLIALLSSAFGNTIVWRGNRYDLKRTL